MGGATQPSATIQRRKYCGDRARSVGCEEDTTPKWQGKNAIYQCGALELAMLKHSCVGLGM